MSVLTRTKAKPPRSLSATVSLTNGFAVNLTWTPIESGAPRSYFVVYRNEDELTSGLTVSSFRDATVLEAAYYAYRVSTVLVTEAESVESDFTVATIPGYPVWETGWSLSFSATASEDVSARATDPLETSLTYSRVGGTAPAGVTMSSAGVVSSASVAGGSYTLILRASNGSLYSDITVSITVVASNLAPSFTVAPTSVTLPPTGGTIQFTAVDPEGVAVTYSLSARSGFSISSTTGLVTATSGTAGTTGDIEVSASDGTNTVSTTCSVTVSATASTTADYVVPVSTATRTFDGSNLNTGFAGGPWPVPTGEGSRRVPTGGDVIEFTGGVNGKVTLQNFTGTSLASPITIRNESGQVVSVRGSSFPFTLRGNTYLTIDGSNGMDSWSPYDEGAAHGFRIIGTDATTTPTGYLKHFGFHLGIRYKRIEVDGRKPVLSNGMMNVLGSDIGFFFNDSTLSSTSTANNGKWGNDDVELNECFGHHLGGEGAYLGVNHSSIIAGNGLPNKDVRVKNTRFVHLGSGGAQLKSVWGGTNSCLENVVVLYSGNDLRPADDETGHGHGLQFVGNGYVRGCWVEQSRESGIKCFLNQGPDPVVDANSPTGYSQVIGSNRWPVYNVYDLEISNNVSLRSGETPCLIKDTATSVPYIGGTRPTNVTLLAHGITVGGSAGAQFRAKIFSNTVLDSVNTGINLGNVATGGVVANNLILGSGDAALSGTAGQALRGNVTTGTRSSIFAGYVSSFVRNGPNADDLHLAGAQPVGANSTRNTHYSDTDIEGTTRGSGSSGTSAPDQGAYEYTG